VSGTVSGTATSSETASDLLRRAVLVLGAALLLVLPRFAPDISFIGAVGLRGPVTVLAVGLAFWLMPVLLVASWAAAGRVRLAHAWLAVPVGLFVIGAVVSTLSASDKFSALVRAAEMTGVWVGFLALVFCIRTDAERRFLLAVLLASAFIAAAVQVITGRPDAPAALLVLGLLVAVGLAGEKWFEARGRGARGLAVGLGAVAAVLLAALVMSNVRGAPAGLNTLRCRLDTWRAAASILKDHWPAGVGLKNFVSHYLEHKSAMAIEEVGDPHNMWLSAWTQLGVAGLGALVSLVAGTVWTWLRPHGPQTNAGGRGAPLFGWLVAVLVPAAPAVIVLFTMGRIYGAVAVAVAATVVGVAACENPSRLEVAGRPLRILRAASVAAVLAFCLLGQVGVAFALPATAWAGLVVIAVSLGDNGARRVAAAVRPWLKFVLMLAAMALVFGYIRWILLPVARVDAWTTAAARAATPEEQAEALRAAGQAHPLAWEPAYLRGRAWETAARAAAEDLTRRTILLERAKHAYREAVARHPRLLDAYRHLAACRLAVPGALDDPQALDAARGYFEQAARLYPTDIRVRLQLAEIADRLKDAAGALAEYRRVLELDRLTPDEDRRLTPGARRAIEGRVRELKESLATPRDAP